MLAALGMHLQVYDWLIRMASALQYRQTPLLEQLRGTQWRIFYRGEFISSRLLLITVRYTDLRPAFVFQIRGYLHTSTGRTSRRVEVQSN